MAAYKPTLARPSARNSRYGIGGGRCGGMCESSSGLSTSPSYCCCCEPEFDPALLLIESRHDALDSPSTPCIRVPSPLAWSGNNVRELRAQRRHVLRHGGRGSILNGVTLFVQQYDWGTCCELLLAMNTWYRYLIRGTCGLRVIRKRVRVVFTQSRA